MAESIIILFLVALATQSCHGYGFGVPETACAEMFPIGHWANASTDPPPYELKVSQTSYKPGDVIEIKLLSKKDTKQKDGRDWFYEGTLVQVRAQDCSNPMPIGEFHTKPGETFLQAVGCLKLKKSAIRHMVHDHVYNSTFYWTAPSTSAGHVFVRATVTRNEKLFWTNVFSPVIRDVSDQTKLATAYSCPVRTLFEIPGWCGPKDKSNGAASPHSYAHALLFLAVILRVA